MNIRQWMTQAVLTLQSSASPRRDAEILLGLVTGQSRSRLLAFDDMQLSEVQLEQLARLLTRRAMGEPVAYLTGEKEFWSLPLNVSSCTLIPRPDTEMLVEQALSLLPNDEGTLLDLGTGTGAVALAIASERPQLHITAIDYLNEVVELAQRNITKLGLTNVQVLCSDWFSALTSQRFNMIVSNPPYIDGDDVHLQQGDVRFEPLTALVAPEAGLHDLFTIIHQARDWLKPQGWLLLEHGWQQGKAVCQRMIQVGYQQVRTQKDYGGHERVTLGCLP
ncbi:peptide chain release factor N(5)-glutamine methyltransferase [Enterobacteriaceae bacterium LUAb1]